MEAQGTQDKEIRDLITEYLEGNEQGMRELLTWFLNHVMDYEVEQQAGAGRYDRAKGRRAHRNGYRERTHTTRHGQLTLSKPQQRVSIQDIYFRNILTCGECTGQCDNGIVSPGCCNKGRDECCGTAGGGAHITVNSLKDGGGTGCSFKVRDGARYVSKALFVVAGICADGHREILGAKIADGEDALLWEGYFDELKARGLHGVRMVISDGHRGITQAVQHSFPNASWQLCQVHFMRNLLKTMAKKHWPQISYEMKTAMNNPNCSRIQGEEPLPGTGEVC